jgi:hypothetical protein
LVIQGQLVAFGFLHACINLNGRLTEDDGVGRKHGELGVKFLRIRRSVIVAFMGQIAAYVEKVKLISRAANAVCKEENVPFQP